MYVPSLFVGTLQLRRPFNFHMNALVQIQYILGWLISLDSQAEKQKLRILGRNRKMIWKLKSGPIKTSAKVFLLLQAALWGVKVEEVLKMLHYMYKCGNGVECTGLIHRCYYYLKKCGLLQTELRSQQLQASHIGGQVSCSASSVTRDCAFCSGYWWRSYLLVNLRFTGRLTSCLVECAWRRHDARMFCW